MADNETGICYVYCRVADGIPRRVGDPKITPSAFCVVMWKALKLLTLLIGILTTAVGCDCASAPVATRPPTVNQEASKGGITAGEDALLVSFDELAMAQVSNKPNDLLVREAAVNLVGKRIRISGYMHPSLNQESIMGFLLTEANLYGSFFIPRDEIVAVWLRDGNAMKWTKKRIHVEGSFSVEEPAGDSGVVYHLRDAVAIPSGSKRH